MAVLADLIRFTTATTGTGTLTVGSAVAPFMTPAQYGSPFNSGTAVVFYSIIDAQGGNSETGTGTYTASGATLTRTVICSTNSGSAINLSGSAQVAFTAIGSAIVNKTGDTMTGPLDWATAVTLASASTVAIGAAASNYIKITGATAITAFDTIAQGAERIVEFGGALTLTYNATSLILPGATNITTAAGDVATFISEGSGNWRCKSYSFAAALPLLANANAAASDVLAGTSAAKFVTPVALLGAQTPAAITVSSHTFTPNVANSVNFTVSLESGQADTLANPTNLFAGASGVITITQNSTTASTLAFGGNWKFAGGTVPAASTTLGAVDILSYYYDGTNLLASYQKGWAT